VSALSDDRRDDGVLIVAALAATFMQSINITLPNAAVGHIQGALSMTDDQIGWVFSSYITSSAILLPLNGWLAGRFGRKAVLQIALALFALAILLVTQATTPLQFVFARILQGAAGAPLPPLALAILLERTPPARHERVSLLWTIILLIGMLGGPGLGGWLSEYHGWQSIFYLSLPIAGFVALIFALCLDEKKALKSPSPDFFGLATFTLGTVALQMLLDRGERLEWFASIESRLEAIAAVTGVYLFGVHMLTAKSHFLDKALFRDRNFNLATIMFFAFGFVLLPTLALTSPMLEELLGYPADTTGYVSIPRSIALLGALALTWRMPAWIDTRLMIGGAIALVVYANMRMTGYSPLMDMRAVIAAGIVQGAGLGLLMSALTRAAFSTLDPKLRAEGNALFNLSRLYGSTIGIAVVQLYVHSNTQGMHLALAEHLRPAITGPVSKAGLAALNEMVTGQAAIIAIIGQFKLLMIALIVVSPLLLFLRTPVRGDAR
jgi:DHA2 family multidrug resistance protein